MKRNAEMLYLSLFFEFQPRFVRPATFEFPENLLVLRVHQIEIEIFQPARFQLFLEQRAYFRFAVEAMREKFVRKHEFSLG